MRLKYAYWYFGISFTLYHSLFFHRNVVFCKNVHDCYLSWLLFASWISLVMCMWTKKKSFNISIQLTFTHVWAYSFYVCCFCLMKKKREIISLQARRWKKKIYAKSLGRKKHWNNIQNHQHIFEHKFDFFSSFCLTGKCNNSFVYFLHTEFRYRCQSINTKQMESNSVFLLSEKS